MLDEKLTSLMAGVKKLNNLKQEEIGYSRSGKKQPNQSSPQKKKTVKRTLSEEALQYIDEDDEDDQSSINQTPKKNPIMDVNYINTNSSVEKTPTNMNNTKNFDKMQHIMN